MSVTRYFPFSRLRLCTALLPFLCILLAGCAGGEDRVVLYCAQDQVFARAILEEFRASAGVRVDPKFDTEAAKSVSLYVEILKEKDRPRCDVFWNNEILHTLRLQQQGLLEPYASPSAEPYPTWAKASDHTWHAFAARARVLLVNTDLVPELDDRPKKLEDLTKEPWKGRVVMAKPMHGTTATHAACLFQALGSEKARAFYTGLKANGVHLAPGNRQVAEWVARGRTPSGQPAWVGMTDTDDAIAEVEAGRPVVIIYPDSDPEGMGTLFIPNTVAILRNCPNPGRARKLVDYLLSAGVEAKLAETASHQIPLNPGVEAELPPAIRRPGDVKEMGVDFEKAAGKWGEAQTFLKDLFTGG